jgi:putative membrane protein
MPIDWGIFVKSIVATTAYSLLGIVLFALSFFLIGKVVPFSLRKEIEEDQNVALAILIASVILGLSIIIASAVGG